MRLTYLMTTEAVKYVPAIRKKFSTQQLSRRCYGKNIMARAPLLLKFIIVLIREKGPYGFRDEAAENLKNLEVRYANMRNTDKKIRDAP